MNIFEFKNRWGNLVEGLQLVLHKENMGTELYVDYINVPVGDRRQGIATAILDEILVNAVLNGYQVIIKPVGDFGTPLTVLENLYLSLGFVYSQIEFEECMIFTPPELL